MPFYCHTKINYYPIAMNYLIILGMFNLNLN